MAVAAGGDAEFVAEGAGEVALVAEAALAGDLGDGEVGIGEEGPGFAQAALAQVGLEGPLGITAQGLDDGRDTTGPDGFGGIGEGRVKWLGLVGQGPAFR